MAEWEGAIGEATTAPSAALAAVIPGRRTAEGGKLHTQHAGTPAADAFSMHAISMVALVVGVLVWIWMTCRSARQQIHGETAVSG